MTILGIESSCDETAAAVLVNGEVRSNVIAGQSVHATYGGVVPELAARAHQEHIVPVVAEALKNAGITKNDVDAVAYTQGPGLIGALLVGATFARSFAQALDIPSIAVDHLKAHVLSHFIIDGEARPTPPFPYLTLTVSGGHTMIVLVRSPLDMEVLGRTLDDAAGEAFDKGAKMLGLPYPGGPLIDKCAREGEPVFALPEPNVPGLDMSFSGVKTAFLDLIRKGERNEVGFISAHRNDLCASLQAGIIRILMNKLSQAAIEKGIAHIAIAGGVSANSGLRNALIQSSKERGWQVYMPPFVYCTDNAAMIAMAGHFLLEAGITSPLDETPKARIPF